MSLNAEERNKLANTLYNYVEEAYADRQGLREFYDHLIEVYAKHGLDGLDKMDREAFRNLVLEAL